MSPSLPKQKSYQTSAGSTSTTTNIHRSGTSELPGANAHTAAEAPLITGSSRKKRRTHTKVNPARPFPQPSPSPQMGGPVMSESELDKKRNKLGYQRISIACSHCRRRKIRCTVIDGDPQSRCTNCIKLKKECLFFPVDQQSLMDSKSNSKSASNDEHGSVHPSSPTEASEASVFDPQLTSSTLPHPSATTSYSGPFSPGSDYPFHSPAETRSPWTSGADAEHSPSLMAAPPPLGPQQEYWRYPQHQHMMGSEYPPLHGEGPPTQSHAYPSQPTNDSMWQPHVHPQQRSMSFGGPDHLPGSSMAYGSPYPPDAHAQHPGMRYPPADIDIQRAAQMGSAGGPMSAPLASSHPNVGQPPNPYMVPSDPNEGVDETMPPSAVYSSGWYPESTFAPMNDSLPGVPVTQAHPPS